MTSEGEVSLSNVGELRVVDLKEELKNRGLATDGKKVSVVFLPRHYCCGRNTYARFEHHRGRREYLLSIFVELLSDRVCSSSSRWITTTSRPGEAGYHMKDNNRATQNGKARPLIVLESLLVSSKADLSYNMCSPASVRLFVRPSHVKRKSPIENMPPPTSHQGQSGGVCHVRYLPQMCRLHIYIIHTRAPGAADWCGFVWPQPRRRVLHRGE